MTAEPEGGPELPGSRALSLEQEADMLLRYSCQQRDEYLHEVHSNPRRGPDVAHALARLVSERKQKDHQS